MRWLTDVIRRLAGVALAFAFAAPSLSAQETHVVLVTGLGGDPAYTETFQGWAGTIRQAALENGVPAERITWLGEDPGAMPGVISARSTKEELASALAQVAEAAGPGDRVLLVFIGHGTSRGEEARFNLPGPDLTGAELDALLDAFGSAAGSTGAPGPTVAVVNTAPASGPWVAELSGPGRIVLTATASAREQNETRFGAFFSEAFRDDEADLDRNGRVSLLEAFTYAKAELARAYEQENVLLTEHALLDDDGDGEGAREPATPAATPDEATSDGALAARFWLGPADGAATTAPDAEGVDVPDVDDPELRRLYEERARLEGEVADLRGRRGEMETEAYESALEELLLEIAAVSRQIREIEGGGA